MFDFDLKAGGRLSCHWRDILDLAVRFVGLEMRYLPAMALWVVMPFCLMCQAGYMCHQTRLLLSDFAHVLWRRTLIKVRLFLEDVLEVEAWIGSEAEQELRGYEKGT